MEGLWKTFRDTTFATWFGWTLIIAIVVFPATATIQSCWSDHIRRSIEEAKLEGKSVHRDEQRNDLMKWMVARGVHPLVARCAILNNPSIECGDLIDDLKEEERATIKDILAHPFVESEEAEVAETKPTAIPKDPMDYINGLDFGLKSPAP